MPEANTMETAKKELVDSFIKYITGVYILQQDFIDDMQGGLQSILEKYSVYPVGSEPTFSSNADEVVEYQEAPKKARKKSSKKEATKAAAMDMQNETVEHVVEAVKDVETVETVEAVEPVEAVETTEDNDDQVVETSENVEHEIAEVLEAVETVKELEADEEPTHIPSHVETAIQEADIAEKKPRKPRTKKEASSNDEPKKKRAITAYRVFVTEFSKLPQSKGLSMKERGPMMSEEWAKIKDDPEQLNVYEQKAATINTQNGL